MATQADLRRLVLTHLTVIDPTDSIEADQASTLDLYIDGATGELKEKGLCWWDADAIPAAVTIPLMKYVASQCCAAFGKAGKGYEGQEDASRRKIASLKSTEERPVVKGDFS